MNQQCKIPIARTRKVYCTNCYQWFVVAERDVVVSEKRPHIAVATCSWCGFPQRVYPLPKEINVTGGGEDVS